MSPVMQPLPPPLSPLLEESLEFFSEVLRITQQLQKVRLEAERKAPDGTAPSSPAAPPETPPSGTTPAEVAALEDSPTFDKVRQLLCTLLQRRILSVERTLDERSRPLLEEMGYVLVAFADEVFVNLPWVGQEEWRASPLEEEFFRTWDSGERVFNRIDELLREPGPGHEDLARLYLLAVSLGFQGRYRDSDGRELKRIRHQLFELALRRPPALANASRRLLPAAYHSTLDGQQPERLVRWWPYLLALAGVLGVYLLVGQLLWLHGTSELRSALTRSTQLEESAR